MCVDTATLKAWPERTVIRVSECSQFVFQVQEMQKNIQLTNIPVFRASTKNFLKTFNNLIFEILFQSLFVFGRFHSTSETNFELPLSWWNRVS